jgi:hypothetical protein
VKRDHGAYPPAYLVIDHAFMNMARALSSRVPAVPQRWRGPLALGFAVLAMAALLILLSFWRTTSGWGTTSAPTSMPPSV